MKLIADSGSTKTHWLVIDENQNEQLIQTKGINPFYLSKDVIANIIKEELVKEIKADTAQISEIFFYGAGCVPEKKDIVRKALERNFGKVHIEVESDLLGAARSVCQHDQGIACILGTGSNSCIYNGKEIMENMSPLGYILGDEGSGAYLGKRFIGDCLKKQLPDDLCRAFMDEYRLTRPVILDKVYKEPMPNRFLASISPFLHKNKARKEIHDLLLDSFRQFFIRNIHPYKSNLPISFVGSIAWYFKEELTLTAHENHYTIGNFLKDPIKGLAMYHRYL